MLPNSSNPFFLTQELYQNVFDSPALGVLKDTAFMSPESINGHIYKANKLKMAKHTEVSKSFGFGDSQRFRSGIHLLSSQGQHSKKRRTDCTSPHHCKNALLTMPSHVTIMQPVLQPNPFLNQNFFNHLHSDNRSSSFAQPPMFNTLPRNKGFQQLSTGYENFQLHSSSGSPSFPGLFNPVPMTKNLPLNHAANKMTATSTLKSHPRTSGNDGDYNIVVGEVLCSNAENYEVISFLGRGTFGQVVKCQCRTSNRIVAIKILKNHPSYLRQGNVEVQILQTLSQHDTEMHNIVRAIECFQHRNHMCLVFELLEQNLYEFLKSNNFRPLDLREIRPIAQQVLTALSKLKSLGLIHADLKPENIMLVCPTDGVMRYRVKVIDFGSACHSSKAIQNTYLQSRYYRAPEILIGLPFNEAIDMWSLGCVIAELFLGWPLYPGSSEYDQIRYIVETQGLPPRDLLKTAGKASRFFVHDAFTFEWRIKTLDEYTLETGQRAKETRKYNFNCLDQIRDVSPNTNGSGGSLDEIDIKLESEDRIHFTELLSQMLQLRPSDRILPDSALLHNFISMSYMRVYPYRKRVQESMDLMRVCYKPYCNQQNLELVGAVQKQHEQAMLDEAIATQTVNAFAAQHLLAFRNYLQPTSSIDHGCHDQRPPVSTYYVAAQQSVPSPIYCHHEQQQCILRPQPPPPPPPIDYNASSIYDHLIAGGSPYATAVAHATASQSQSHQSAAAAAALMMQSEMMAVNGTSPTQPLPQSRSSASSGEHAVALAIALAATSYTNKAGGVRGQPYVLPSSHPVTQQFSGIESATGVNQNIDCLMNYMPGVMPDSVGCTSTAHTPQRHQRCRPENDMALFLLSSSSAASVAAQNLSYSTHQYPSNHLAAVAPISLISPQKPHLQMRVQQPRQRHSDATNSSAAAAVTASSLAVLSQLLLNGNSQTVPTATDQLIWEDILHEHQRKSGFFPAEFCSKLIQLGKNNQACCYGQKCQFLHCGGHQHYHFSHRQNQRDQIPTQTLPLQASPPPPPVPSPHLRPSSQQQLTDFLQGLAPSQPLPHTTSTPLSHKASDRTHDNVQSAVNLAHHIFPHNCQRSASSSSSPRATEDDAEVVNITSSFTESHSDETEGDGPIASALRSPASPNVVVAVEMPVLAQSSSSIDCSSSNSGERLGPPKVMGAANAEVSLIFSDVTNACELDESTEDIHTTASANAQARGMATSARNRSSNSPFENTEVFGHQFISTQEPTSLIHRPDKKIPVGRVHPMKKAECDDSACFAQPKARSFNYCYAQPQAHTVVPACSNTSLCCSTTAFTPESSDSAAAAATSAAAFLFNNTHAQRQPALFPTANHVHSRHLNLQQQQQLATVEAYRNLILLQQHINLSAAAAAQFITAASSAVAGAPSSQVSPVLPFSDPVSGGIGPGGNHSLEQLTAQFMVAAAAAVSNASSNSNNNNGNTNRSHYL